MINEILEQLASDNSRLFKENILRREVNDADLVLTIKLALDPFTQFYQRKIPSYTSLPEPVINLNEGLRALENLSSRKVTGNAAIEYLRNILSTLSTSDAKVIEKVVGKDLECGVSVATVNKVWSNLIPEYPCMLASGYDKKLVDKITFPAYVQLKLDGMRFNAIVKDGAVEFKSRNGKEIQINDPLFGLPFIRMADRLDLPEVVFDGELLIVDSAGKPLDRKTGNGILNKAVKGTMSPEEGSLVRAVLWDYIPLAEFSKGVYNVPYKDRMRSLNIDVADVKDNTTVGHLVDIVPTETVNDLYTVQCLFEKYLNEGQEGIIYKSQDMIWENKRSKKQIKFKGELECDLVCVGWEEGTGKYTGKLGALVLRSSDNKIRVNVGTGFSDQQRDGIVPSGVVGKIVAVKYNAKINDRNSDIWSLFLPVFIEIREDKLEADSFNDVK